MKVGDKYKQKYPKKGDYIIITKINGTYASYNYISNTFKHASGASIDAIKTWGTKVNNKIKY